MTDRTAGPAQAPTRSPAELAFMRLANGVTNLHPDDLPALAAACGGLLGGTDVVMLLVDMDQRTLRPFGAPVDAPTYAVDDDGAGRAYRHETVVQVPVDAASTRLWIAIKDSAERVGVLGITVPTAGLDVELWEAFTSIVGECIVSKGAYGDGLVKTRRSRPMSLAAEMRWSLLPPLTFSSPVVEISGLLEPAYDIAGDTFDYAVDGDTLSLAVLDAMGHGLEAARMANLAVSEYRRGRRRGLSLREIVADVDAALIDQFGSERYVTGQLATLDLATGTLAIINAGHPRPVLFRNGLDHGDLTCPPCPPMGLRIEPPEPSEIHLEPGDAVLFLTDGITEARSATGDQFGRARVVDVVESTWRETVRPAEILRRLAIAVHDHGDQRLDDDASLVVVRWLGPRFWPARAAGTRE